MSVRPVPESSYGEVFTRRWVVEVLLDLTGYTLDRDLASLHLLEPACGSGAFLGPAVERLIQSAQMQGHDLAGLSGAVRAYDLQERNVKVSRALCTELLVGAGLDEAAARTVADRWVVHGDFLTAGLLSQVDEQPTDVAIGNPPYVRYDDLPEAVAAGYRQVWSTMRGRGDIYIGFFERCLSMLRPGGRLGFICADRWMRNQYGAALRELVGRCYSVEHVWTMHDVDAFESPVSAYPAITVLANAEQGSVVVAETTSEFSPSSARDLVESVRGDSVVDFAGVGVQAHRLPGWFNGSQLWPTGAPTRLAMIERLNDGFGPLHDSATGTKVSIGVATGADDVYVTIDPNAVEADRLLPLAMSRDLASGAYEWSGHYLVNPWAENGSLVRLDDYPRLAGFLHKHPGLRNRFVARKDPRSWYRTIDKVNAGLVDRPKLLLQDMKAFIHPVLEPGGHYPHHNLYYIISDQWNLEVLGGLLLSRIAQAFIEAYCVRMRGGTLRFQAQYLKQIRVPHPESIDPGVGAALLDAFRRRDLDAATAAAADAYGIDLDDYGLSPSAG